MCSVITSVLFVLAACSATYYRRPPTGPWVTPTRGEPWPKPQQIVNYEGYVIVRPTMFTFEVWNVTYNWTTRRNKGHVTGIGEWEIYRFPLWDVKVWYYVRRKLGYTITVVIRQWRISVWTESNSRWGPLVRFCEHDNELTVSSNMVQTINITWSVYGRCPVLISVGTQNIATVFFSWAPLFPAGKCQQSMGTVN